MNDAENDDEIIEAAHLCQLVFSGSKCDDIVEKAKKVFLKICVAEVTSRNLSDFAVQYGLLGCKQILGKN